MRANRFWVSFVVPVAFFGAVLTFASCAVIRERMHSTVSTPAYLPPINAGAENVVLNSVNGLRGVHHMRRLAISGNLTQKARYWARWMALGNCGRAVICHSSLTGGINVRWSWLAENVGAATPQSNVMGVVNGFRNSPLHAANILSPRAQYVGVGVAYAGNTVYVVEEFMQT